MRGIFAGLGLLTVLLCDCAAQYEAPNFAKPISVAPVRDPATVSPGDGWVLVGVVD